MSKTQTFNVKRLVTNAVLIALFFVLSMFSVTIGGIKITFASLPGILAGMLFGPIDGFIVGFLGAFLEQMLKFGFTPTTLLWMLPPAMRGLCVGLGTVLFKKQMSLDHIFSAHRPYVYYLVNWITAVLVSLGNTGAYYVDSILYDYYSYALIFGVLGTRILSGLLTTTIVATVVLPVLAALRRTNLVRART
ncbi:MAG: folate family ECF transporter S component [Candidatus Avoscillospira sp.]